MISTAITAGASRVASGLLCLHAVAITPAGSMELVRSFISTVSGLSLCNSQVGSCTCSFAACSAFTHVTACTLAESPSDSLHRKLRQLRCLHCRFDCYRVERTSSRAGVAPAEVQRLSRRTVTPTTKGDFLDETFLVLNANTGCYMQAGNLKDANRVWKLNAPLAGMYWFTYQKVQSSDGSSTREL